jgi:hypothetical protein
MHILPNVESHAFHAAIGFEETERIVYFKTDSRLPVQHEPNADQCSDHSKIIGTKIPNPVKGQDVVQMVPVYDQFGKGDPA